MIVERLKLQQFRNYDNADVNFEKGLNIILGQNGAGKTNIVEGIYYLSFARSFRTLNFRDLIKKNKVSNVHLTIYNEMYMIGT